MGRPSLSRALIRNITAPMVTAKAREALDAEELTVYCPLCDTDLWRVPLKAVRALKIARNDLTPLFREFKRLAVPLDCLACGSGVFSPTGVGRGFEFYTREKGLVPKRGSKHCVRINKPGLFDRRNVLSEFRAKVFGSPRRGPGTKAGRSRPGKPGA